MAQQCVLPFAADTGLFYQYDGYSCSVNIQKDQGYIAAGNAFLSAVYGGKKDDFSANKRKMREILHYFLRKCLNGDILNVLEVVTV